LPLYLAEEWQRTYDIAEFDPGTLDKYAAEVEDDLCVSRLPGAPPPSSAVLERGAARLGVGGVGVARVFPSAPHGTAGKHTMARPSLPAAVDAGALLWADCKVLKLLRKGKHIVGARCERLRPDGTVEPVLINAEHVFVCCGASQTPAVLQRSGIRRNIGRG